MADERQRRKAVTKSSGTLWILGILGVLMAGIALRKPVAGGSSVSIAGPDGLQGQPAPTFESVARQVLQGSASLGNTLNFLNNQFHSLDAEVRSPALTFVGDMVIQLTDASGVSQGHVTVYRPFAKQIEAYEITLNGSVAPQSLKQGQGDVTATLSFALTYVDDVIEVLNVCEQNEIHHSAELGIKLGRTGSALVGAVMEFRARETRWMPITLTTAGTSDGSVWETSLGEWVLKGPGDLINNTFDELLSHLQAIRGSASIVAGVAR